MSTVLGLDIKQMAQDLQVELTETISAIRKLSDEQREELAAAVDKELLAIRDTDEDDEDFEYDTFETILCYQIMNLLKDTV